ncbi:DNA-binding response regulator [Arcobacter sp. CECT 8983]|uniref:response regulator transcription factor n=1 Tax=Arcobacter sp. CECT 8983 TaxID=2044508 RepID=UPI00100A3F4D|nr:response regulator transcription factor [Arcobacter sp. CECT 8983]RXJ90535.1 DNA-binding response regulator [Arcobacter sp. CECT 8983]
MKKNILIIEDEEPIINIIKNRLDSEIYNVDTALDGQSALKLINTKEYDLITLDIMLPKIDGFTICNSIRNQSKKTLIVMISALDTEDFKTKAYDYGIDDYIAKPFSAKELSLKIKSLLKRRDELTMTKEQKKTSAIFINDEAKEVSINNFIVDFTPSEYFILSVFTNNKNRVYSRQELAQLIYDNYLGEIDERGIDSHICNIRKKISAHHDKDIIKTIRGIGYKIDEN